MTCIYFVRHAEPDSSHANEIRRLSEKGRRDRDAVTAYLRDKNIARVLSSPYPRAVETVEPLAYERGLMVELVPDFRERRVTGEEWIDDYNGFCQRQWADFSFRLPGGESLAETQERNQRALRDVLRRYEGLSIAIGSHGTALSALLNAYVPSFGYEEFMRIKDIMPWLVCFSFRHETPIDIISLNPLTGRQRRLLSRRDDYKEVSNDEMR